VLLAKKMLLHPGLGYLLEHITATLVLPLLIFPTYILGTNAASLGESVLVHADNISIPSEVSCFARRKEWDRYPSPLISFKTTDSLAAATLFALTYAQLHLWVAGTLQILHTMRNSGVNRYLFS
jgi:hypothetical protein